jgi:putative transposase
MARRPRVYVPGVSVHVIQRGNNRCAIVGETGDYEHLLSLIKAAAKQDEVAVHGYAVMTTHYHLIVTPRDERALPSAMQRVNSLYVRHYNRKYGRTGTLWNGRYRAILIPDDRYWLTCLRYIDQNPARAGIVRALEDYRWSSYRAHALGEACRWLAPHPLYVGLGSSANERQAAYRAICGAPLTEPELMLQRRPPRPARAPDGRQENPAGPPRRRLSRGLTPDSDP